jgi:hypothetical protein
MSYSAQMPGGPGQSPALPRPQGDVDLFERPEKSGKRLLQTSGPVASLTKVLGPELVPARYDGCSQRPVFVRALNPGEVGFPVDP